jgi:hypothetical protein
MKLIKMVGLTRSTCGLSEARVQLVMSIGGGKSVRGTLFYVFSVCG